MVLLEISQRHDKGGGAREQVKPYNGESMTGQFFYIFDLNVVFSLPHTQPYLYDGTFKDIFLQFGECFCRKSNLETVFYGHFVFANC